MNAIIVGNSDEDVLKDQETDGGLRNYFLYVSYRERCFHSFERWFRSFGFSSECLGQHAGDDQAANLGDGHGYCKSTLLMSLLASQTHSRIRQ